MNVRISVATILASLGILFCGVSSCSSDGSNKHDAQTADSIAKEALMAVETEMEARSYRDSLTVNGKKYTIEVERKPDTSLPKVRLVDSTLYTDNTIFVRIAHADKSVLFQKSFHKADFASLIQDASFLQKAVLEGIALEDATEQGFTFTSGIGCPDTDLSISFTIEVSLQGTLSIKPEKSYDP